MAPLVLVVDLVRHARHGRRALASLLMGLCAAAMGDAAGGQEWGIKQDIDPDRVIGHQQCAECHKSENAAWEKSHHYTDAWSFLGRKEANDIAERLEISAATSDVRCTTCHGTQQKQGNLQVVSCESCHGAAGDKQGEPGWFKVHHDFGDGLDPKSADSREKETQQHYTQRLAECDKLGMRRSENLYALAKNCYECHIISSETLVNTGKHPIESKGFEFMAWAQGEVRHNSQLDQAKNAEAPTLWTNARFAEGGRTADGHKRLMYVIGQLAALEVSLRNRAVATVERGDFFKGANEWITDGQKNLKAIDKAVKIAEIQPVLAALATVKRASLRKFNQDDKIKFGQMANVVAQAGVTVAATHNGNNWKPIDDLFKRSTPKGDVHQPKP